MNNVLSYCGSVDVRINAADQDLPVNNMKNDILRRKLSSHKEGHGWCKRNYILQNNLEWKQFSNL